MASSVDRLVLTAYWGGSRLAGNHFLKAHNQIEYNFNVDPNKVPNLVHLIMFSFIISSYTVTKTILD